MSVRNSVFDRIRHDLTHNDVVLYMKGTPAFPYCGFSAAVVQVLNHMGVNYKAVDVMTDPSLWDGLKQYSNWPTLPQLYANGQFVGGCDIVREMFQTGELAQALSNTASESNSEADQNSHVAIA